MTEQAVFIYKKVLHHEQDVYDPRLHLPLLVLGKKITTASSKTFKKLIN